MRGRFVVLPGIVVALAVAGCGDRVGPGTGDAGADLAAGADPDGVPPDAADDAFDPAGPDPAGPDLPARDDANPPDTGCVPACGGRDCGPDGCGGSCGTCDASDLCDGTGACVPIAARVTGRLWYESRGPTIDDWGVTLSPVETVAASRLPAVVLGPDGGFLGSGETNADGGFTIPVSANPPAGSRLVFAASWSPDGLPLVAVLKPSGGGTPAAGTAPAWAWTIPLAGTSAGEPTITEAQGSGALRLFQVVRLGMDQVRAHLQPTAAPRMKSLAVLWSPGTAWSCELCFAASLGQDVPDGPGFDQSIFVGGAPGESGAWATAAVLHEFGHYVEDNCSRNDSPGGPHTLRTLIAPSFAWAEGFANFFAVLAQTLAFGKRDGVLWAITQGGKSDFWIDFAEGRSLQGAFLAPDPKGSLAQDLDECYVTGMLWDLWDGLDVPEDPTPDGTALGTASMLRAAGRPRFLGMNRGASGADFVDFVDSVLCDQPSLAAQVTQTVSGFLGFPYDGQPACP